MISLSLFALLVLVAVCYLEMSQAFLFRPALFSSKAVVPRPPSKSVSLQYTSIKVEREPEEDDAEVVDRFFSLLAESDVLDIAMAKQRMSTPNDEKKRKRINARVKTLKYADDEDEEDEDEFPDYGDSNLPEYQDLGM